MNNDDHQERAGRHLILWDGECGMCRRAVEWFIRRDTEHEFTAVPYQDAPPDVMTPDLHEACKQAVHVIKTNGEVLRAGRATLFILDRINWAYGLPRLLAKPPLIPFVELGYKFVAANRQFFSKFMFVYNKQGVAERTCKLPSTARIE